MPKSTTSGWKALFPEHAEDQGDDDHGRKPQPALGEGASGSTSMSSTP